MDSIFFNFIRRGYCCPCRDSADRMKVWVLRVHVRPVESETSRSWLV